MSIYTRYSCTQSPFTFSLSTTPPGIICFTDKPRGRRRWIKAHGNRVWRARYGKQQRAVFGSVALLPYDFFSAGVTRGVEIERKLFLEHRASFCT